MVSVYFFIESERRYYNREFLAVGEPDEIFFFRAVFKPIYE